MTATEAHGSPGPATEAGVRFAPAQAAADTLFHEGEVLYPYRASAPKNQRMRWQWGVLVPPAYRDGDEPSTQQTECLVIADEHSRLHLRFRHLHVQERTLERAIPHGGFEPVDALDLSDGSRLSPWQETVEEAVDATVRPTELVGIERSVVLGAPSHRTVGTVVDAEGRTGRVVKTRWPLTAQARLTAACAGAGSSLLRVRITIENTSPWTCANAPREHALRHSLIAVHTLVAVDGGHFVSLLEPPPWAATAVDECHNVGVFPVLAGPPGRDDLLLSSPILVYDHPAVAPESGGDFCDAAEIDELLTLRTLTLTDEERRAARGTDPRAAGIIDRVDAMPGADLLGLHGTRRDAVVAPRRPSTIDAGAKVRLRLGKRRSDVHDVLFDGRTATVWDSVVDSDGQHLLKVTLDDDPASELQRELGRYLFFRSDEVEPLPGGGQRPGSRRS